MLIIYFMFLFHKPMVRNDDGVIGQSIFRERIDRKRFIATFCVIPCLILTLLTVIGDIFDTKQAPLLT